jgi:hypothetical protein
MARNKVELVDLRDPKQVALNGLVLDVSNPSVETYALDMNEGVIAIGVSEPVGIGLVSTSGLTIKSEDGAVGYTLTSSIATLDENQRTITITISDFDLNQIKANVNIGTSRSDSVLVINELFAKDTALNSITAIDHSENVTPLPFVADTTPIAPQNGRIELGTGIVKIQFTEAVDVSRFVFAKMTFIAAAATSGGRHRRSTDRYRRTSDGVVLSAVGSTASVDPTDPTIVIIQLGAPSINAIKSDAGLCTSTRNCFITFDETAIAGFDGIANLAVTSFSPLSGIDVVKDEVPPTLSSFSLDMDTLTVTLEFDETVDASSFEKSSLIVQNSGAEAVTLAPADGFAVYPAPGTVSNANLATITVHLDSSDANSIKAKTTLGTNVDNTYLTFLRSTVKDMSGNPVDPPSTSTRASDVVQDNTPPVLQGGALNMNIGVLTLTFDETVDSDTLRSDSLAIQGSRTDGTNSISLTTSGTRQDHVKIIITIDEADLNDLKQNTGVATGAGTSFLTIAADAIKDMSGNSIDNANESTFTAFNLLSFVEDTTNPTLQNFYLNMSSGILRLIFSETVDVDTLAINKISLQCSNTDPTL